MDAFQLKVENIPAGIPENRLKIIFQNTKQQGGGPVSSVVLDETTNSSVITFQEKEAVERVLQKGQFVNIYGNQCPVHQASNEATLLQNCLTPLSTSVRKRSSSPSTDVYVAEHISNKIKPTVPMHTVKIIIKNVQLPRDCYELYLEDESVNTGEFDKSKIFMDGLNNAVYVPFLILEDAQKVCTVNCETEENIKNIEMAQNDIFDHYPNLLSIHGMDFDSDDAENKLIQYVKDKSGFTPRVVKGEEPCSVILDFDEKVKDLYNTAWICVGELDGFQLVTAPVKKSSTILAHVHGDIDQITVKRYFKSKKREGGCLRSFKKIKDKTFLVTFQDVCVVSNVIGKKDHAIGLIKINTELWHHCLSREAYENYCAPGENADTFQFQSQQITETIKFKVYKYTLLHRSEFNLMRHTNVIVENNKENNSITIKGEKGAVKSLKSDIYDKLDEFVKNKTEFDDLKLELMCNILVQKIINDLLAEKGKMAYIYSNKTGTCCYLSKDEDAACIKKIVDDAIQVYIGSLDDQITALRSEIGREYISKLEKSPETPCWINLLQSEKEIEIYAVGGNVEYVFHKIKTFLKQYEIKTKTMTFPELKHKYISKYLQSELSAIEECVKSSGGSMTADACSFTIQGHEAAINETCLKLSSLRETITIQDYDLNFFGIAEYVTTDAGSQVLEEIGKQHQCLITMENNLASKETKPQPSQMRSILVGNCYIGNLQVNFVVGDIMSLAVDVIVNPIDQTMILRKGFNKIILEKGGDDIQVELDEYQGKRDFGTMIKTTGGRLPCSSIFHLIMDKRNIASDLSKFVKNLLKKADQDDVKSFAMNLIGCGRFKISEVEAALNISKGLKLFSQRQSSMKEIIICDMDPSHIRGIMDHFDNVNMNSQLDDIFSSNTDESKSDNDVSDEDDEANSVGEKRFGSISLTIKQGDILQEKCDAIVCGLKNNMNLGTGGKVSKTLLRQCGASLQAECNLKATEMLQSGAVCTSATDLLCSAIIFVSMNKFSNCWDQGVEKVLSLAEMNGYTSIALPAFGTGPKKANVPRLKDTILSAIKQFGKDSDPQKLREVRLVIFDKEVLDVFQSEKERVSSRRKINHKDLKPTLYIPLPVISDTVKLNIVYQNVENGSKACNELTEVCERNFHVDNYKSDRIKTISTTTMKDITNEGLRMKIRVTVKKENGSFTFEGFDKKAIEEMKNYASENIWQTTIAQFQQDMMSIKTAFKWQSMKGSVWRDFDSELNIQIEKAFQNSDAHVDIHDKKKNHRQYRIDFKTMKKYRLRGDSLDSTKGTTVNRFDLEAASEQLPQGWDDMGQENLKVVSLSSHTMEYRTVQELFEKGGANVTIKKIERIQNEVLYRQYASKRKYFEKHNPKDTVNEKQLFHGTGGDAVANINASGFNRSYCGKNGTAYGNGVYFSTTSSYSVSYAKSDDQGNKLMYVARVLVGEPTQSSSGMNYLPNKPSKNVPYDSGHSGNIYVIFNDSQAYPEYLVTFR